MKLAKWLGLGLVGVLATLLVLFAVLTMRASSRRSQHFETHRIQLALPAQGDATAIARGKHLMEARYGCMAWQGPRSCSPSCRQRRDPANRPTLTTSPPTDSGND